jgi:alpha/beta superfamily hydrolase
VPADTILIHGEADDTIPCAVLDWARPQDIPVIVIPGADHFFHRKLGHIKNLGDRSCGAPEGRRPR